MPTQDQMDSALRSAYSGVAAKVRVTQKATFTVNGATTVLGTAVLPAGSDFRAITLDTPTAISGAPTSCLFRAGTALHGQQVVADVDAKAQGHIAATIVAALDKGNVAALATTTIFMEVTTVGGGTAGPIVAYVEYDAPIF